MSTEPRPPLVRRLRPGHRLLFDCLVAIGYAAIAGGGLLRHPHATPVPLALAAVAVLGLTIALRRRQPVVALGVALVVLVVFGLPYQGLLPAWSALYLVAVTYPPRIALAALGAALVAPTVVVGVFDRGVLLGLISGLVWTIGYTVGRHRVYERELRRQQARQAEADLERARRGVTEERMRIAREVHDVVAHSMSVITVQAGFGDLVLDDQPAQARAALGAIATTGREALTEMRRLLGMLRDDGPAALAPAPGLGQLDHLVAQTAKAGVRVQVKVTGAARPLPPGIDLSAFRIVQEALTNVVKHAGTAGCRVAIGYGEHELSLEITDDGRGGPAAGGYGHGLIGMRERVHLYGGTLEAAPLPGRGFRVAASLPVAKAAV
ncbi:sensor histidine kinase [Amycolatopsis mediterranei]|uniref:sensor histidine kinase n=1 Tax=Amycolatopsis mediterranei TaxID=33910 RepID=UPI003433B842